MIFADNLNEHDPSLNLAFEEYVLRHAQTDDDILLFYVNEPSIIIGRHQNTIEEINLPYVEEKGIHVVRRLSGGGAVYHDLGNLNFSFITRSDSENFRNFKKFTEPVIRCLQEMGIPAELSGRNDIVIDGRKISGNAQYIAKERMASHGTLLVNSDLTEVSRALNVSASKIASKGVKSVRSRVANISEFLNEPLNVEVFRQAILNSVFGSSQNISRLPLTTEDHNNVIALANERYRTWDWNFGRSPDFNIQKKDRFPIGEVDVRLDVGKGKIQNVKIYGDFFAIQPIEELEKQFIDLPYRSADVLAFLQSIDLNVYISGLDPQALTDLLV